MLELNTGVIVRQTSGYSSPPSVGCTYFSFVNDANEISENEKVFDKLSYNVYCREQLSQTSLGFLTNKSLLLYGFLPLAVRPNSLDTVKLQITVGGVRDRNRFLKNIDKFLRPYEESLGVREFKVYPVVNVNNSFILDLDSKWLSSPLLISTVALIIRVVTEFTSLSKYDTIENYFKNNPCSGVINSFNQIDLHFLLKNIDEVLGDNPITGFDDFRYGFSDTNNTEILRTVISEYTLESGKVMRLQSRSIDGIGVSCGLLSLSSRVYNTLPKLKHKQNLDEEIIDLYRDSLGDYSYINPLGLKWVCNLIKLLSKNK